MLIKNKENFVGDSNLRSAELNVDTLNPRL